MDFSPVLILAVLFSSSLTSSDKNLENMKVCVPHESAAAGLVGKGSRPTWTTKHCDRLEASKKSPLSCHFAADRSECLEAVSAGVADFAAFEPEDLYYSILSGRDSILVASEIRDSNEDPYRYGMVVVARKSVNVTGTADLFGKRLCHPGFGSGLRRTDLFDRYFEERVAPSNCDVDLSVYEDRMKTTSDYFGAACMAGPWVSGKSEDARLKRKYSNLCSACHGGSCEDGDNYRGGGGSVVCLKDGAGDVLWAKYEDIVMHQKYFSGHFDLTTSDYDFLCDDGTTMPFEVEKPCIWLAKPWPVIAANRKSVASVQKMVDFLRDEDRKDWEDNLIYVITLFPRDIRNLLVSKTPRDYLSTIPGYLSASAMSEGNCKAKHYVKLCASSNLELEKCMKMSKAALALAVRPSLDCVRRPNLTSCMDSVEKRETDVAVVPPDFLYDAITRFRLKSFLFEWGISSNASYLASIVVKKNSDAKRLRELKNKKLCLTRENGIGWKSLVVGLREERLIESDECDEREGLSNFFGEICVANRYGKENLPVCCPTSESTGNDEIDVLRCLRRDGCEVTVVDVNSLKRDSDFQFVCRSVREGECHRMWSYPNYLMTSKKAIDSKLVEMVNVFSRLGEVLGGNKRSPPLMNIFGSFNGHDNVLFRNTSRGFVTDDYLDNLNNYYKTVERMKACSKGASLNLKFLPILIIALSTYFIED